MINAGYFALGTTAVVIGAITFYPNVKGYIEFKAICEREAGLRITSKIASGEGWILQNQNFPDPNTVLQFPGVAYVRVIDPKDKREYDYVKVPGAPIQSSGVLKMSADPTKKPKYRYNFSFGLREGHPRVGEKIGTVYEVESGIPIVVYSEFGYSFFDPDRTLLAAPASLRCPDDTPIVSNGVALPSLYYSAMHSAFTK